MFNIITRINRIQVSLHFTQLFYTNYFINGYLIWDFPCEQSIGPQSISPIFLIIGYYPCEQRAMWVLFISQITYHNKLSEWLFLQEMTRNDPYYPHLKIVDIWGHGEYIGIESLFNHPLLTVQLTHPLSLLQILIFAKPS